MVHPWFWWLFLLIGLFAGCEEAIQSTLDDLAGKPQKRSTVGTSPVPTFQVPPGNHLVCLTNIGHTLAAFSLAEEQVLPDTRRVVDLDPVGPWFQEGLGYYLSRVHASGAGANALIEFDPKNFKETRRLRFPPNSNPNQLLLLPAPWSVAWVALRGSTFDNFTTNGIAVVDLAEMEQAAMADLNDLAPDSPERLSSLLGFRWDGNCGENGCAYGLVNNWMGEVRTGRLLVLEPGENGAPQLRDLIDLGLNPQKDMLLAGDGVLWVANNGGYADFLGEPGTVQALDTAAFGDDVGENETLAILAVGGDPTGIYAFSDSQAWVTSYPDDLIHTIALDTRTLEPLNDSLPRVTGPVMRTGDDLAGIWAGAGGFSEGRLARMDAGSGALLADLSLESGSGPVSCAETTIP